MPVAVLQEMQQRLPKVRLWNLYGQTEIAPLATVLKPEDQLRKAGSAGRAVLNVETRVVDDAMQDVAPGEVGEIVHRSPHLLQRLLPRRGAHPPPSRAAGSTAATWAPSTTRATSRGRPQEGHDQDRRRERGQPRGGGGALPLCPPCPRWR
jgi:acyl-CoA synthetase (AMP-forming)/AMP-acid ligase II